jgi:hypothetical protein
MAIKSSQLTSAVNEFNQEASELGSKLNKLVDKLAEQTDLPITLVQNIQQCNNWESKYLDASHNAIMEVIKIKHELQLAFTKFTNVVDKNLKSNKETPETETAYAKFTALQKELTGIHQLFLDYKKDNPFPGKRRLLELAQYFKELEVITEKAKELKKLSSEHPNNKDYEEASQKMDKTGIELDSLGQKYINGDLNAAAFKSSVNECIHNKETRLVLDKHRRPAEAEFLAILKNILSIIALFIPIITNKGFFSKAPTDSSQKLDKFNEKTSVMTLN